MGSLLVDLLMEIFVDPFFDYFLHELTVRRVLTRLISGVVLFGGLYLAFFRSTPLSYVGWVLLVPAGLFIAYDTLTAHQHVRR